MSIHAQATQSFYEDLIALTKPKITLMTLIVAIGGMVLAHASIPMNQALLSLLGVGLLVSGSSTFNMYMERDYDGLMARTSNRPLPSKRLKPFWALLLGFVLSLLSLPLLYLGANELTLYLGVFSLIAYVLVYTPMKRMSALALVVGAVPGAMPALMGYTAASGRVDEIAIALFSIAFFWQLPHVLAISIFRGEEYEKAGYPVAARVYGLLATKWFALLTTFLLVAASLSLFFLNVGGYFYLVVSLLLGAVFIFKCFAGFFTRASNDAWSKNLFFYSLIYQTLLFLALAIDIIFMRVFS